MHITGPDSDTDSDTDPRSHLWPLAAHAPGVLLPAWRVAGPLMDEGVTKLNELGNPEKKVLARSVRVLHKCSLTRKYSCLYVICEQPSTSL